MIKLSNILLLCVIGFMLASCSQVLETVEIGKFTKESILGTQEQDEFEIQLETLTLSQAKLQKNAAYSRNVMVTGIGNKANVYSEASLLKNELPPITKNEIYRLGVGDELTFVQIFDNENNIEQLSSIITSGAKLENGISDERVVSSNGRVGSDGSILLLGIGRLDAEGKTINSLRSEVRNILIRNGVAPNFQLEITGFLSKKAYFFNSNIDVRRDGVVPITEIPLSLKELAAKAGYVARPDSINLITLKRNNKSYRFNHEYLFEDDSNKIYIQDKDQLEFETFEYKLGQVYALSGGLSASIIPINPINRETMADVMFLKGGPLSNQLAKRSEIYLLRGNKPVTAYHLDAQNASRILVAAEMELRPNDIIYVAQRPIVSFTRLISELTPLRFLLRDIQDNNIP